MTTPHDPPLLSPTAAPARPFFWSVRRELWENRSITIAPLVVAAIVLFASALGTIGLPARMRAFSALEPAARHAAIVKPYGMAPAPIMLVTFLVGIFYALDALYGERRDGSILFWKSLPVSDLTTVLSKASIPLVALPLIGLALGLAAQRVLLLVSTAVLLGSGVSPASLWGEIHFFQDPVVTLYGLTVHVLWFAPIYAWLLLVSAWARRTPVLWAALPFFAIGIVERLAFHTTHFGSLLAYRVTGAMTRAFTAEADHTAYDQISQLAPGKFLATPGLWVGLAFAAACLAAAVRLRRDREPN